MTLWQWALVILVAYIILGRVTYVAVRTAYGSWNEPINEGIAWPFFWALNFGCAAFEHVLFPIMKFIGRMIVWFFTKIFFPIFTKGIFPAIDAAGRKASTLVFLR